MFGWFKTKCPLATAEKVWVESSMDWLAGTLGCAALHDLLEAVIPAAWSHEYMRTIIDAYLRDLRRQAGQRLNGLDIRAAFIMDDQVVAGAWDDEPNSALHRRNELLMWGSKQPLDEVGDAFYSDRADGLLRVVEGPAIAAVDFLTRGVVPPPRFTVDMYHQFVRNFGALRKLTNPGL